MSPRAKSSAPLAARAAEVQEPEPTPDPLADYRIKRARFAEAEATWMVAINGDPIFGDNVLSRTPESGGVEDLRVQVNVRAAKVAYLEAQGDLLRAELNARPDARQADFKRDDDDAVLCAPGLIEMDLRGLRANREKLAEELRLADAKINERIMSARASHARLTEKRATMALPSLEPLPFGVAPNHDRRREAKPDPIVEKLAATDERLRVSRYLEIRCRAALETKLRERDEEERKAAKAAERAREDRRTADENARAAEEADRKAKADEESRLEELAAAQRRREQAAARGEASS